jgi:hypothetical protein
VKRQEFLTNLACTRARLADEWGESCQDVKAADYVRDQVTALVPEGLDTPVLDFALDKLYEATAALAANLGALEVYISKESSK